MYLSKRKILLAFYKTESMKQLSASYIALLFVTFAWNCSYRQDTVPPPQESSTDATYVADSVYSSKEIITDTNIVNKSGRRIVALYNSVDDFLEKTDTAGLHFPTECMICEAVIPYENNLLFANQLELSAAKAIYNKLEHPSMDSVKAIRRVGSYDNRNTVRFHFSVGTGQIRHLGQSCNDAYLKEVVLKYEQGDLKIRNVLNAEFFEYDMDRDGQLEQYILAMRNCSQELAVLQVL